MSTQRLARGKTPKSIFHIMCRSNPEVDLYKYEDDKVKYPKFIKKYQKLHEINVYGYCLRKVPSTGERRINELYPFDY